MPRRSHNLVSSRIIIVSARRTKRSASARSSNLRFPKSVAAEGMADRYFPNEMPDFVEEQEGAVAQSTLHSLLCLPYTKLTDKFLRAALDLKEKVALFRCSLSCMLCCLYYCLLQVVKETWLRNGRRVKDFTLYTGALGTAFLLFKAYQSCFVHNGCLIGLSVDLVWSRHVTFICGRAGVCALGAVIAKHAGDNVLLNHYLSSFREVFQDEQILGAAEEAAKVVWSRGLLKRVGICHGISGNTYVFLSLYRLTGRVEYLYRAKAFACFLLDRANQLIADGRMHSGDRPYSMFEGQAGMAHLFLDMIRPSESRFPAYEL
ncbi:hypothetical protein BHE74_00014018 [Ensete ventricosum]|nr:hypothetical protein GW17_00010840 [Ensete ventricosum]RWW77785.1 hypothetical protein BHE74_00014018 [Ensete ventricosum]RZR93591.1 hypothetical protein BHM03_00022135 [Ensete ventricosum]